MAENNNEDRNLAEEMKIDDNLKEIMNKASKNKELTKDEIKKLEAEARESLNFLAKIDEIKLPKDKYVVFTDGNEQLIYDDGEFFLEDTVDSTKIKKKKKRAEARELYIEYFIKHILNKIAQKNALDAMVKNIAQEKENGVKVKLEEKEPVKKEKVVKPKVTTKKEVKEEPVAKEAKAKKGKEDELVR